MTAKLRPAKLPLTEYHVHDSTGRIGVVDGWTAEEALAYATELAPGAYLTRADGTTHRQRNNPHGRRLGRKGRGKRGRK